MAKPNSAFIYTSIISGKDVFKTPLNLEGAKFLCFTDSPTPNPRPGVIFAKAHDDFIDPTRNARIHKILAHEYLDCEYSLWMDGSITLMSSLPDMIKEFLKDSDMAVFKHSARDCVYDEAEMVKKLNYDFPQVVDQQMAKYRVLGYPAHNGLHETGVILRRHTKPVEAFNNAWWAEVSTGSRRDQLSFDYVLWKTGLKINELPLTIWNNMFFTYTHHAISSEINIPLDKGKN